MFQHLERSGSNDSHNKDSVVYVVLSIVVIWCGVDEAIPETPFFYSKKEKEKKKRPIGNSHYLYDYPEGINLVPYGMSH